MPLYGMNFAIPDVGRRRVMREFIQIGLGLLLGTAGFYKICEQPVQGICALFLAGLLVLTGFEKKFLKTDQKSEIQGN